MILQKRDLGPMFDCMKTKSVFSTRCWSSANRVLFPSININRVLMNTRQWIPSMLKICKSQTIVYYLGQKWYLGWMIKLFMSNKTKNVIPFGKVSTSFGKLLKYACLIASVADILFLGTHYRTNIATLLWLLQQIAVILFLQFINSFHWPIQCINTFKSWGIVQVNDNNIKLVNNPMI